MYHIASQLPRNSQPYGSMFEMYLWCMTAWMCSSMPDSLDCVYVSVLCVASGALICHSPDDASADHNGYHVCSYVHGNS